MLAKDEFLLSLLTTLFVSLVAGEEEVEEISATDECPNGGIVAADW